jgi:hypothetical protein
MKALVNKEYLLEKFPGKGGWTFARIPEILQNKENPFGWVTVKGTINGYKISNYKLMPMGNGCLFLPVKAAIRKAIGKQEGDYVKIILFADNDPLPIPQEMLDCLRDEPLAYKYFFEMTSAEQKKYIDWIYAAKKESTRIDRMANAILRISNGLKLTKSEPSN